jgi:hypothetical protein
MNNKKIYIVDKLVIGYNHIVFNAAITSIVSEIYKDKEVVFISESLHAKVIAEKNGQIDNLTYSSYNENVLPPNIVKRIPPYVKKKIVDILFIRKLYKKRFGDAFSVFFTCLSITSLFYAAYKARLLKVPVYFFLHGEVEFLFVKELSFVNKIRVKFYKLFLSHLGDHSKVLALSDLVKTKLVEEGYLAANKIILIDHPLVPTQHIEKPISENIVIFGHIGIAIKKKKSALFFELSKFHVNEIRKGSAEFRLIGKIEQELLAEDIGAVKMVTENNGKLMQAEYEQSITDIDYAIFTFTGDNYVYRASGSVTDAINFIKPIIALKHDYFNYLFQTAGNIGFLCDDINSLNALLKRIIERDEELLSQYEEQKNNLRKLKQGQTVVELKRKLMASL